jgi:hypothetical protein
MRSRTSSGRGGLLEVLTDHAKVPIKLNLCVQYDEKNIETIKPAAAFSDMAEG